MTLLPSYQSKTRNMSDKDLPYNLDVKFFLCVLVTILFSVNITNSYVVEQRIVSKVDFPADCIDPDGATRAHLEEWTSASGSCDRRICYNGAQEITKWQINYDCPIEIEYLDTVNCRYYNDTSLTFPGCCPVLECDERPPYTTTTLACADRSPTTSCEFWKTKTDCIATDDNPYNFTVEFCDKTCGVCTA